MTIKFDVSVRTIFSISVRGQLAKNANTQRVVE